MTRNNEEAATVLMMNEEGSAADDSSNMVVFPEQEPQQQEGVGGQNDPTRMVLTDEERDWALAFKEAIKVIPELDEISDFMCAQIAIVNGGDLEKCLDHAHRLQHYREEYDVRDTFSQGKKFIRGQAHLIPGHWLHYGYSPTDGCYSFVVDLAQSWSREVHETVEGRNIAFGGSYYVHHAMCPDFESIRQGVVLVVECEGYQRKSPRMADIRTFSKAVNILSTYPMQLNKFRFYHTGVLVNTMAALVRRVAPRETTSKFVVGCQSEERLDSLLMFPTPAAALERLIGEMTKVLEKRYENERSFQLE